MNWYQVFQNFFDGIGFGIGIAFVGCVMILFYKLIS